MAMEPRIALLLALGDDELVIGHRHSQWTGVAPHLEEDLAFSSIAQDEIGHAVVWYAIAADHAGADAVRSIATRASGDGDLVDALGLGRDPQGYRNAVLCERPNRDWGYTIGRQYLYDTADELRLEALADSSWKAVAEATGALRREERYHLMHARAWVERLASGPVDARQRLGEGLAAAFAEAFGLFEPVEGEDELVAEGILPVSHADMLQRWLDRVSGELAALGLERVLEEGRIDSGGGEFVATASGAMLVDDGAAGDGVPAAATHVVRQGDRWVAVTGGARGASAGGGLGGRRGDHSEDFMDVWEEMTGTYRAHPGASW